MTKTAEVMRNTNSRPVRAAAALGNFTATMINETGAREAALGLVSWFNQRDGMNLLRDTVGNLIGRTRENAPISDMISKTREQVQQVRQNYREALPAKLAKAFSKPPSQAQKTAMFKALGKTDLAAITSHYDINGALNLITDSQRLSSEIQTLERSIRNLDGRRFNRLQAKSRQLANHMMTGEHGVSLLTNAEAIARLLGERGMQLRTQPDPMLVSAIDRLVTLYAIERLDQTSRDAISELNQEQKDQEGLDFVVSYLIGQRVDELGKIGSNQIALLNHYKGHIPSEAQQGGSLRIASDSEYTKLVNQGYTVVDTYDGSSADRSKGKRSYYFAPVSGLAPFSQGVMQTVHRTASGIDPESGFTVGEVMAGRIEDQRQVQVIQRQISNQRATKENLRPVWDDNGQLVAYERMADVSKLASLNRSTDLFKMIGAWKGRQVEEMVAEESNRQLIDNLNDIWKRDSAKGRKNEFVNIAQLSPDADRILREAASLVPRQTKEYADSVFGKDEFWVRRDMLLDTFGARQASVGDLFTGNTRWKPEVAKQFQDLAVGMFGRHAYLGMVGAEKNVQELVTNAKNIIVVKLVGCASSDALSGAGCCDGDEIGVFCLTVVGFASPGTLPILTWQKEGVAESQRFGVSCNYERKRGRDSQEGRRSSGTTTRIRSRGTEYLRSR